VSHLLTTLLGRLTALERHEAFLHRMTTETALSSPLTAVSPTYLSKLSAFFHVFFTDSDKNLRSVTSIRFINSTLSSPNAHHYHDHTSYLSRVSRRSTYFVASCMAVWLMSQNDAPADIHCG